MTPQSILVFQYHAYSKTPIASIVTVEDLDKRIGILFNAWPFRIRNRINLVHLPMSCDELKPELDAHMRRGRARGGERVTSTCSTLLHADRRQCQAVPVTMHFYRRLGDDDIFPISWVAFVWVCDSCFDIPNPTPPSLTTHLLTKFTGEVLCVLILMLFIITVGQGAVLCDRPRRRPYYRPASTV